MFLSLHWWNNIVICQKKIQPTHDLPLFRKILISIIEKKLKWECRIWFWNGYCSCDFFHFSERIMTPALAPYICKNFNIHCKKKWKLCRNLFSNGYCSCDFFSFFWTDNAPCPPYACPLAPTYVKILISIVEKKWKLCRILFSNGYCSCDFFIFLNR